MFFHFNQNNSGGKFQTDFKNGISADVIIEAGSAEEANDIARTIGLYFDGYGDCQCCGNRWYSQYRDADGTKKPEVYGREVDFKAKDKTGWRWIDGPEGFVHYKDGRFVPFESTKESKPKVRKNTKAKGGAKRKS